MGDSGGSRRASADIQHQENDRVSDDKVKEEE
jgi:hypothetical protein